MWQGLSVAGAECGGMWQSGQGLNVAAIWAGVECDGIMFSSWL